ncbi:hypothetical protein PGS_00003200 [Porphyromonas gingivalis A7A1-28]|nr:hypothetical protein PGA7_00002190 [Porphyromonas gingivalis]ALO29091.1 hypothetical protein PGS_00003200 [Porphyromonas gingivalis A7A1-28]
MTRSFRLVFIHLNTANSETAIHFSSIHYIFVTVLHFEETINTIK